MITYIVFPWYRLNHRVPGPLDLINLSCLLVLTFGSSLYIALKRVIGGKMQLTLDGGVKQMVKGEITWDGWHTIYRAKVRAFPRRKRDTKLQNAGTLRYLWLTTNLQISAMFYSGVLCVDGDKKCSITNPTPARMYLMINLLKTGVWQGTSLCSSRHIRVASAM